MAGVHLILDGMAHRHLNERGVVEECAEAVVALAGLVQLGRITYELGRDHPAGPGVSLVLLVATSHVAIHTWPELDLLTADIYSCIGFEPEPVRLHLEDVFAVSAWLVDQTISRVGIPVGAAMLSPI